MKQVKGLTPAELIDEERRWVIVPGDFIEQKGFRVEVVFEDHPFRFAIGQISNMPKNLPEKLPYFPATDSGDEEQCKAQAVAEGWCLQNHGIDNAAYLDIVSSSIRAYERGIRVRVLGDDLDRLVIANGFGDEIQMDEEAATKLYQDLADALDLPCQRACPVCAGIMEGGVCEECDE